MKLLIFFLPCALFAQTAAQTAAQPAAPSGLSYEFFRDKVQPIFLAKRPGHARCIECHDNQTPRLQPLAAGATTWTEEQSRRNFDAWKNLVVPGNPAASRMLMHPLAQAAGGDPFHAGGKHWQSQDDPEWQTLKAWVMTGAPQSGAAVSTAALDFNYYLKNIQPIFLKARRADEGTGNACASCHTRVASRLRLQPLIEGAWSMEASRANFQTVAALVTPGDPAHSRLLLHPLAPAAGGDPTHTGGKFWANRDNPEWQTIAAWVNGATVNGEKAQ
jgi:hypothetical protein